MVALFPKGADIPILFALGSQAELPLRFKTSSSAGEEFPQRPWNGRRPEGGASKAMLNRGVTEPTEEPPERVVCMRNCASPGIRMRGAKSDIFMLSYAIYMMTTFLKICLRNFY